MGSIDRHPEALFGAPRAEDATIYIATKPDRGTDGRFFDENVETLGILTDSEIQAGRWLSSGRVDPGSYFVLLRATADLSGCFDFNTGVLDPSCADGFSNVLPLTVPKPSTRYAASTRAFRFLGTVDLRLRATPLGEKRRYRVCWLPARGKRRCITGSLDGFSWDSPATDSLSARTRGMRRVTTFTWFVAGRKVSSVRALVR